MAAETIEQDETSTREQGQKILDDLFVATMKQNWEEVVRIYTDYPSARTAKLTNSDETALHVVISSYRLDHPDGIRLSSIEKMINSILPDKLADTLSRKNDKGNTILHLAAAVGCAYLCKTIASKHNSLIKARNENNETPLFAAARYGNLKAFLCLHESYMQKRPGSTDQQPDLDYSLCRGDDGNTILHSAIAGEHFELAFQIISKYKGLMSCVNLKGESPLHLLAMKPNVFASSHYVGPLEYIIYHCLDVEELKECNYAETEKEGKNSHGGSKKCPASYETCLNILNFFWWPIKKSAEGLGKSTNKPTDVEEQGTDQKDSQGSHGYPPNYTTCILLFKFGMKVILTILGFGFNGIKSIQDRKRQHEHAFTIMSKIIEHESEYMYRNNGQEPVQEFKPHLDIVVDLGGSPPRQEAVGQSKSQPPGDSGQMASTGEASLEQGQHAGKEQNDNQKNKLGKKKTSLLIAAEKGVLEMVKKIIKTFPIAIHDLDSDGKNVLLLAAQNRHTLVFKYLLSLKPSKYLFDQVDKEGNTILHLAARLQEDNPWVIPGPALQMQWEMKWYEYVKRHIPRLSYARNNDRGETAMKIFTETHKELKEKGAKWLIKTSESCSLVAALVATVAFATSATVPGGLKQDSGHPVMEGRTAFDIFSISSLIALCLAVTSLVFFLAIITSRCEERNFKSDLPNKLLMGLTALFASIAAILVSFCAGHTFILRPEMRAAAVPIYAIACVPLALFALAQLRLYCEVLQATLAQMPLRSYGQYHV